MCREVSLILWLAVCCGIFYRMGGKGKPFASWYRDWVCPAFIIASILVLRHPKAWYGWLMIVPAYGFIGGMLSTYWDWLTRLWRKDEVKRWENWLLHGFFAALGALPLVYGGSVSIIGVVYYASACSVACMVSSELISNATWEEVARGVWVVLAALLVLA